jgi:protein TonB
LLRDLRLVLGRLPVDVPPVVPIDDESLPEEPIAVPPFERLPVPLEPLVSALLPVSVALVPLALDPLLVPLARRRVELVEPVESVAPAEPDPDSLDPVAPIEPELAEPALLVPLPEPVLPEPVLPEPVLLEPLVPEPLVPEPLLPEPLLPEPLPLCALAASGAIKNPNKTIFRKRLLMMCLLVSEFPSDDSN